MKMITKKNSIYVYLKSKGKLYDKRLGIVSFVLFLLIFLAKSSTVSAAFQITPDTDGKRVRAQETLSVGKNADGGEKDKDKKITFSLYNTRTGKPISGFHPIAEGAIINLAKVGKELSIVMHVQGIEHVGSVTLGYNKSRNYQLEEAAPYAIQLDYSTVESEDSKYESWAPVLGDNQVAATLYKETRAKGEVLSAASISFKVVDELIVPEETEELNNIIAYPNPTVNEITIAVKGSSQASFKLVDPAGTVVKSGDITTLNQEVKVNVHDLKAGLYYIRMLTDEGISVKKIFINK